VLPAPSDRDTPCKRVRVVTSSTGAGHTRVAEALAEALTRRHGAGVDVHTVDVMAGHAPFPINHAPALGAAWTERAHRSYGWGFRATNGRARAAFLLRALWPRVRGTVYRLFTEEPADVVVSTYSLVNHFLVWGRRDLGLGTPIVTVVTDPLEAHRVWLAPGVDRALVGSEAVRASAVDCGLAPGAVRITGLPVDPAFTERLMGRADARSVLGWDPHRPVLLLVGGGDGIGSLDRMAAALDAGLDGVQLAVITARNRRLYRRLRAGTWRNPMHVHGFVDHATEMSVIMSAADILVTKAGPGTLHDAYLAGLPVILCGSIPGQEDANMAQVVEAGAGVWAPRPAQTLVTARRWLEDPAARERAARRSASLARPEAAATAAEEIWDAAGGAP